MLLLALVQVSGTIKGRVVGEGGSPLEGAVVVAISLPDSQKAGGTYAGIGGYFEFHVEPGKYILTFSFVGHEKKSLSVEVKDGEIKDVGTVRLKQEAIRTREVTVEAEAPKVTFEGQKKVIRFSEEYASKGGSALDALKNTPGVEVDNSGNVKVRNTSNITLYIDGRPTVLEVSDALQQIPASSIDRIEIITNPGAKYEAEGGVIMNIVLKKNAMRGTAFNLMGRIGTFNNYGINSSLGTNAEKIKFMISGRYFSFANYRDDERSIQTDSFSYAFTSTGHHSVKPYGLNSTLEYRLTDNDIFTFDVGANFWNFSLGWNSKYDYGSESDLGINLKGRGLSGFLDYTKHFLQNHTLSANIFYGGRLTSENTLNFITNGSGDTLSGFRREGEGPHEKWRVKVNYTWKRGKDSEVNAGYQGDLKTMSNVTKVYDYDLSSKSFSLSDSTPFDYERTIHAAYITYSDRAGNLGYDIGLRVERQRRTVRADTSAYTFTSTDPFPSIHLSYNLDLMNSFRLSYSRRIWNPRPWMLNPVERVVDQRTIMKGNPDLKPQYTHSFEGGYQRILGSRGQVGADIFYKRMDNNIEQQPVYQGNNIILSWWNLGYSTSAGVEVYGNYQLLRFLSVDFSTEIYDHRVYTDTVTGSLTYSVKGGLTLGRGPVGLQIKGRYSGPRYIANGYQKAYYSLDLGLRLPLSRHIFIIGQFQDFLKLLKFESEINTGNLRSVGVERSRWPSVSLMLLFDYNNFRKLEKELKKVEGEEEDIPAF